MTQRYAFLLQVLLGQGILPYLHDSHVVFVILTSQFHETILITIGRYGGGLQSLYIGCESLEGIYSIVLAHTKTEKSS